MSKPNATGRALVRTKHPGIHKRGGRYAVRFTGPDGKVRQRSARTLAKGPGATLRAGRGREPGRVPPRREDDRRRLRRDLDREHGGRTRRGIRPETLAEYRRDLAHTVAALGRRRLAEIGPPDLRALVASWADGLRPATVRRRWAPARAMFASAVEDGLIRANPAAGLRIATPREDDADDDGRVKALSVEELARLIGEVPEGWPRTFASLLAETGLRLSEGLELRWIDLDVAARRLVVRQRARDGKVGPTKSARGRREVPLSAGTARALAAHRLGSAWSADGDLVFAGEAGDARWGRGLYAWSRPPPSARGSAGSGSTRSATPPRAGGAPRASRCRSSPACSATPTPLSR